MVWTEDSSQNCGPVQPLIGRELTDRLFPQQMLVAFRRSLVLGETVRSASSRRSPDIAWTFDGQNSFLFQPASNLRKAIRRISRAVFSGVDDRTTQYRQSIISFTRGPGWGETRSHFQRPPSPITVGKGFCLERSIALRPRPRQEVEIYVQWVRRKYRGHRLLASLADVFEGQRSAEK
ncbi:hypothetical protein BaRGS_00001286 [Batillaria attramentaria]|uniref:Uncharacterized protein n=1 Tax=Batillaria attramentaria TaxID=370345 RepID=A0ABD0M7D1_9CAEN